MERRPTIRDIARLAKLSHSSVSLALREHPSIPLATRERIKVIAKEIGYSPDPMLSALMVYRRGIQKLKFQGSIAWISPRSDPMLNYITRYQDAARERCLELGYRLEEFRLAEMGMKMDRLSKILRARGISGLLLTPQTQAGTHIQLDWENFSAVTFGFSLTKPQLHVVMNAQFRSSVLAFRQLQARGYQRIGYVTSIDDEERTDRNFSAGYLSELDHLSAKQGIPILRIPDLSSATKKKFTAWYRAHRPQAIMTILHPVIRDWMRELGFKEGIDYALALLGVHSGLMDEFAGIDQNEYLIGRAAVDFLISMIHRNERGIPAVPVCILVEGKWVDGRSVKKLR